MASNATTESLDSFIDIIANTVGVIIILAVGGILVNVSLKSNKEKIVVEHDAEIARLSEEQRRLDRRHDRLQKSLVGQRRKEAVSRRWRERLIKRIAESEEAIAATARETVRLSAERDAAAEKSRAAQAALDTAMRELGASVERFSEKDLQFIFAHTGEQLGQKADELLAEVEALSLNLRNREAEYDEASRSLRVLSSHNDGIAREIAMFRDVLQSTIDIADRLQAQGPMLALNGVECYRPKRPLDPDGVLRMAVRLINDDYYNRHRALVPHKPGESTLEILSDASEFQSFLGGGVRGRSKPQLVLFVRPGAHEAYRIARRLAEKNGWETSWEPLGETDRLTAKDNLIRAVRPDADQ